MKKNKFIIAIVVATGMMFGACGSEQPAETEATETEASTEMEAGMETEMEAEPTAEVNTTHAYICPMQCENSASHEAGQCPVCGMDLAMNENFAGSTDAEMTDDAEAPADGDATEESAE